jgi:FtsH-binding integral membrane protein
MQRPTQSREDMRVVDASGEPTQVFQPRTGLVENGVTRSEMIRATYRMLAVGLFCAMASSWWASRTLPVIQFLVTGPGIILSLVAINAVPLIARKMLGSGSMAGTLVLALDGLLSGLALSPLVFLALIVSGNGQQAPNLVQSALVITAFAFLGVTAYVHTSKSSFNWSGGLFSGLFFSALGLLTVGFFFPGNSMLNYLLLAVVGVMGVVQLLYGTSKVLNDPNFNDPISGALILFAGIFNLFQVVLSLLLSGGRSRD